MCGRPKSAHAASSLASARAAAPSKGGRASVHAAMLGGIFNPAMLMPGAAPRRGGTVAGAAGGMGLAEEAEEAEEGAGAGAAPAFTAAQAARLERQARERERRMTASVVTDTPQATVAASEAAPSSPVATGAGEDAPKAEALSLAQQPTLQRAAGPGGKRGKTRKPRAPVAEEM